MIKHKVVYNGEPEESIITAEGVPWVKFTIAAILNVITETVRPIMKIL